MKNVVLFLSVLFLGASSALATANNEPKVSESLVNRYSDSFIFVENGITFSVYPDGEFDFYIDDYVSGRRNGVTFNSGYDYSPYAQYDDYGAVVQVENVPIYYDYYGRVTQIGDVDISYNRNRVRRVGGMYVYYNRRGFYDYHTGYINVYNRNYVYSPFHAFFARPAIGFCLVFNRPYRRYYSPVRYTYYHPYNHNTRRAYAKIGSTHRYNKIRSERSQVYRNDRRVAVRDNAVRSNTSVAQRGNNSATRSNRSIAQRSNAANRGRSESDNRSSTARSNQNSDSNPKAADRTATQGNDAVNSRTSTSTRSTQTYKSPQRSTSNRSTTQAPSRTGNSVARSSSSSRSISKAPTRSKSTVSTARSSSSRNTVSRTPSRSNSNNSARTSSSRSARRN